jgi:hypothetical protein
LGGVATGAQEFPYYVRLFGKRNFCGATLIASDTIITGAHCVLSDKNPSSYRAEFLQVQGGGPIQVAAMRIHEEFRGDPDFRNDIVIMFLSQPAPPGTIPAPLGFDPLNIGQQVTLIGMGQSQPGEKLSKDLNKVESRILEGQQCIGLDYQFDDRTMLCVDGRDGRTAAPGMFCM